MLKTCMCCIVLNKIASNTEMKAEKFENHYIE